MTAQVSWLQVDDAATAGVTAFASWLQLEDPPPPASQQAIASWLQIDGEPVEAAPAAPGSVVGQATGTTTATVTWADASGNETGFEVQLETPAGSANWVAAVGGVNPTAADVQQFLATGLAVATDYTPRVRALGSIGNSAWTTGAAFGTDNVGTGGASIPLPGTTPPPPPPPQNTQPAFSVGPASVTVQAGATASFSVTVTGTPIPTLQWRRNGAAISGATAASYSLVAQIADTGATFDVAAQNTAGTATSSAAVLTVTPAPTPAPAPAEPPVKWMDWANDLAMFAPDCPVFTIEQALRRRADDFFRDTRAWRATAATVATTATGQSDYTVSVPSGLELAGLPDIRISGKQVQELSDQAVAPTEDPEGETPDTTVKVSGPSVIQIYPTPVMAGLPVTASLAYTIGRAAEGLPYWQWRTYREAIEAMTLEYLMNQTGKPWSNPQAAVAYRQTANRLTLRYSTNSGVSRPTPRLVVRPSW